MNINLSHEIEDILELECDGLCCDDESDRIEIANVLAKHLEQKGYVLVEDLTVNIAVFVDEAGAGEEFDIFAAQKQAQLKLNFGGR